MDGVLGGFGGISVRLAFRCAITANMQGAPRAPGFLLYSAE